jgi:replicative DNA helicase
MIDLTLLRCLADKKDYTMYRDSVPLMALEARTQVLITDIDKYFKVLPDHDRIDFIVFRDLFYGTWHRGMEAESIKFYDKVLTNVDVKVSSDVKTVLVNSLIELKFATDAGNAITTYTSGEDINIVDTLTTLAENTSSKLSRKEHRVYEIPDFDTLMHDDTTDAGLSWRSPAIGRSIRKLRDGDFLVVAGRPDKGKTSFVADNATHFASQATDERPVLWLSNEGVRNNIIKRSIQAACGLTTPEMVSAHKAGTLLPDYYKAIGSELSLQIEDICGWTNFEVAELIEQVNPCLLIIDMIDKVKFLGVGADARTDQKLEEMYSWFRELGIKREYATIALSQISASACDNEDSQMWPQDWMLKDSRTGKQGACDLIMMIGHSQDPLKDAYRYLSTPKNKLQIAGAPSLRAPLLFDKDRSRFKEVQA